MILPNRTVIALSLIACGAVASTTSAQRIPAPSFADSATTARNAWTRAAAALQRADTASARAEIEVAAAAWPTQSAYLWARAVLAGSVHDSTTALEALRHYAALGLGRDLAHYPAFTWFTRSPDFSAVAASHAANMSPRPRSRIIRTIPDSTFWPEGVDFDSVTGRYYVASVRHKTIAEVWPDGSVREIIPRDGREIGAVLGVRVDAAGRLLWATTSGIAQAPGYQPSDSARAQLLQIRLDDDVIVRRWNVPPSASGHVLGDLAIGPRGDVFVSDSDTPVLYRLRPGASELETLRSPLFRSLQGIAPTPDGRRLYVADYSYGLLRVDLETGEVIRLADAPGSTSVGCDGIAWDQGAIIAVQNGVSPARIMRFTVNSSGTRITRAELLDRNSALADEPTIGTIVGRDLVYVANSQWEQHGPHGERIGSRPLAPAILLAVPLR